VARRPSPCTSRSAGARIEPAPGVRPAAPRTRAPTVDQTRSTGPGAAVAVAVAVASVRRPWPHTAHTLPISALTSPSSPASNEAPCRPWPNTRSTCHSGHLQFGSPEDVKRTVGAGRVTDDATAGVIMTRRLSGPLSAVAARKARGPRCSLSVSPRLPRPIVPIRTKRAPRAAGHTTPAWCRRGHARHPTLSTTGRRDAVRARPARGARRRRGAEVPVVTRDR
jgi:hypothetical protein